MCGQIVISTSLSSLLLKLAQLIGNTKLKRTRMHGTNDVHQNLSPKIYIHHTIPHYSSLNCWLDKDHSSFVLGDEKKNVIFFSVVYVQMPPCVICLALAFGPTLLASCAYLHIGRAATNPAVNFGM